MASEDFTIALKQTIAAILRMDKSAILISDKVAQTKQDRRLLAFSALEDPLVDVNYNLRVSASMTATAMTATLNDAMGSGEQRASGH